MFQARRRRGSLSRACVLLPSAAVDDAHHDDMVFTIIKKLLHQVFTFLLFVYDSTSPRWPYFESSDAQNMKESHDYLLWRTVGPGVITERTYASLTPNREKQMQVLKHTTQSHKQGNSTLLSTIKCMGSSQYIASLWRMWGSSSLCTVQLPSLRNAMSTWISLC